jgi:hypothetical protein
MAQFGGTRDIEMPHGLFPFDGMTNEAPSADERWANFDHDAQSTRGKSYGTW